MPELELLVKEAYNPFLNIPKAPPANPFVGIPPAPKAALPVPTAAVVNVADDAAARAAWSAATRAAWRDEYARELAKKIAQETAEIAAYKRANAAAALSRGLKAASIVQAPFLVADIMEVFAPGVHQWLRGGWKGTTSTGIPLTSGRTLGNAGRCNTRYNVVVSCIEYTDGSGSTRGDGFSVNNFQGPITILSVPTEGLIPTNPESKFRIQRGDGAAFDSFVCDRGIVPGSLNISIVRTDGQPDTCGPLPAPPAPAPYITSPRPTVSPYTRDPASPRPFATRDPAPFLLPPVGGPIVLRPSPSPLDRFADPNPYTTTPSPDSLPREAPRYTPAPKNPRALPQAPQGCGFDADWLGSKLDTIQDTVTDVKTDTESIERKVDTLLLLQGTPEPCPEFDFPISTVKCGPDGPQITSWVLKLAERAPMGLERALSDMADAAAGSCNLDNVLAFPDWWQVRLGADRPQIVVSYRVGGTSGYASIALPWPADTTPWKTNKLGNYVAGPYSGVLILRDNSKFVVNCQTSAEANRMLDKAQSLIRGDMLGSNPTRSVAERRGAAVTSLTRVGRGASFYPTGQRDISPAWKTRFSNAD